jgi:glycosyltransferase involved in cell wall biosynthesis
MTTKEQAIQNLKDIKKILNELGIIFWLDFGTLLGAYRDKDFCEGDEDDIDFGLWYKNKSKLNEIIKRAEKKGFSVLHNWKNEATLGRGDSRVDLFFYHRNEEEAYTNLYTIKDEIANYVVVPAKLLDNFQTINFYQEEFLVPSPVEEYLKVKYGDWKTPISREIYRPSNSNQHKAVKHKYDIEPLSDLTILITTFKRPEALKRLLKSIKEYYPKVKIIVNDDSEYDKGVSWSRNYLVSQVKTPFYLLLDDDFVFSKDTKIELLLEKLKTGYDIVAGAVRNTRGEIIHYEARLRLENGVLKKETVKEEPFDIVLNFFVAKKEVSGWDEEIKIGEHSAFFWDHKGKWRIGYDPNCIVDNVPILTEEYNEYRGRALTYIQMWMKKKGITKSYMEPKATTHEIPKIIHQFWVGDKQVPMEWINTWKEKNPNFKHMLWTEKEVDKFGLVNRDKYDIFYKDKCFNGCSDVARYEILKKYGGIYIDADCVCLESFEDAPFMSEEFFVAYEGDEHYFSGETSLRKQQIDKYENVVKRLATSPIGTKPNHPILDRCIEEIGKAEEIYPPWRKVANVMLTRVVKDFDIKILPPYMFFPTHHDGFKNKVKGKVYSDHYFGTTKKIYKEKGCNYKKETKTTDLENIAFCIKTLKRPECLEKLMWSIVKYYPEAHISVADDDKKFNVGFYKDLWKRLMEAGLKHKPVAYNLDYDTGLSACRNFLISKAEGEYVLILDDDFVFTDETDIMKMKQILDSSPDIGIVGGTVLNDNQETHFECIFKKDGSTLYQKPDTKKLKEHKGIKYKTTDCVFNFALMKKEVFNDVKWDNKIKIKGEHTDFYLRLKETKWKVAYCPEVKIDHQHISKGEYREMRARDTFFLNMLKKHGLTKYVYLNGRTFEVKDGKMINYKSEKPITLKTNGGNN